MKNITLLWRSLTVAVFVLFASGMQAQIDCGVNRSNISIQVNNTCSELNIPQHPYITIDFGPGSGNLNGTAIINVRPFFSGPLTLTDVSTTVEVSFGLVTFQLDPNAFLLPGGNNTIQLLDVNFVDIGCSQDFSTGAPVVSNPYVLGPNSTLAITDDPIRNIIPPCQGVPTGRLSLRVTPGDGNFTQPNRFSVRVLPDTLSTIVNVTPPGTFPNTVPGSNYYIVETNQSLTIGDYTFLLFDNVTNCEVAYDVSLGDPNAQFMVVPSSSPVTCFGDSDGSITIDVAQADPLINGVLSYTILDNNGFFVRNGTLTAPGASGYVPETENNLSAGTYTVNLSSGNGGCMSSAGITISTPPDITATVSSEPICASASTYTIDVASLTGVFGAPGFTNLNYRVLDDNFNSTCWNSTQDATLITASGDYALEVSVPAASGCFDPTQDFTTSLTLEIFQDGTGTCRETFDFDLFVKATPPTPEVVAYTIDGADSLASRLCSGADIELLITNYDEDLTYNVELDGNLPPNVVTTGVFDDASFAYTGVVSGTITNNNNSAVQITYNVTATNGDAPISCDSEVESITIRVRPQPFLTAFAAGTATDTVCSGSAYSSPNVRLNGSNGSTGGNANMRWNYEWDVPASLTYNGGLALSAEGLMNNATTGGFAFENTSQSQQVATLTITPIFPQMITTLSGATVADTCFGESYAIALTVEPVTNLEIEANGVFAGDINFTPVSITICDNSDVTFESNFFGVAGARYKVARILTNAPNVTNGNFGQLAAETRDLDDSFTETLRNSGSGTETVTYEFRSYTYGPDGVDSDGDDCIGESLTIEVNVLPGISNGGVVNVVGVAADGNGLFNGESICSFSEFSIDLSSSLNPGEFRYEWTRTVSGGSLIGNDVNNSSGSTSDQMGYAPEIEQELATDGNSDITVTYSIVAVTPGPDGFLGTLDDCTGGDMETVSVTVEPTPTLAFDLNGSLFTFDGDTAITICSGDDFLIDNLVIPQDPSSSGDLKYIEFDYQGDASFLDVMQGDQGVYSINNFQLGTTEVVNTSPDNSFQVTQLQFTPYFENQDNTTSLFEECAGETITITVIINPAVPDIMAQDIALCSSEELETPLMGGTGSGGDLLTILSGEVTFSDQNNEFIIPAGAREINNISFELDGANGGASTGSGNNGGAGYHFEGFLNSIFAPINNNPQSHSSGFPIHPGDTVRTVLGASGADGVSAGNGGDASSFIIYAGPNSLQPQGSIVYAFVAGGGGGAGANNGGSNAFGEATSLGAATDDGTRGASFGGFGGLGFPNGFTGGAGASNGGGGGGGYSGGDGGGNLAAVGGEAGTSLNFGPTNDTYGRTKNGSDGTEGAAFMSYTIVFDDVNFTLVDKTVSPGLVDLDPSNVTPGVTMGSDTLLYGEAFQNPTNDTLSVTYELTTTTEAGCGDAGTFSYTLIIEPNATLTLTSGNTMITGSELTYEATVCSGDQIEVFLGTDITTLSDDPADVYYTVSQTNGTGVSFFDGNDIGTMFTGQAMPIRLYESGVINNTGTEQTVTYLITPYINQADGDCVGETVMLTLTVQPGFAGNQIATPMTVDVCSNSSLTDAGFDLDANLGALNNGFDTVLVNSIAVGTMSADFTSTTDVTATDRETVRSMAFFGGDVYRNLTGSDVSVTYTVQLVSEAGCRSLPFDYTFNIYAEPVIDTVPSPTNVFETTICSGSTTGINVAVAGNSASIDNYNYFLDAEMGLELTAGGNYPEAGLLGVGPNVMQNDEYENKTSTVLTATYSVVAISDDGCSSDTVQYVVSVEPEPMTDIMLVAGDSTSTYGLFNARAFLPNPVFEICANQEISTSLVNTAISSVDDTLMARVIITDFGNVTRFDLNAQDTASFLIPVSELADSLSFAANELMNTGNIPDTFTVSYSTFFRGPNGFTCGGTGTTEFDVVILPSRNAEATARIGNTTITGDTLCSGTVFDLRVRDASNVAGAAIDSFLVEVTSTGLTPEMGTMTGEFVLAAGTNARFRNDIGNISFTNPSAGVKMARYIVRPFSSNGCLGLPDTADVFYLPETVLNADIPLICGVNGISTAITPVDSNLQVLSTDRQEYRWEYIGGTASGFSIEPSVNSGFFFVANPSAQANTIVLNNQATIVLTPGAGFTPGEVRFEVIYDNTDTGCGTVTDTVVISYSTEANPGTLDPSLDILCDGVNFLLTDALDGESEGGVFTDANGMPVGSLNFTPMIGGSDPTPVAVEFTYTVGGGNSGCPVASTTFEVMVEPAPNAGMLNMMADNEACQSAVAFNLFDIIDGAMPGGAFTQTAGVDFVAIASDGVFNQNSITAGTYVFDYEVTSANGCGNDVLTGITVEVLSQMECTTTVPCDTINLLAGFNVISFDALPADMTVENIFADEIADDNLLSIFSINPDTRSSEVYSFNPVFGTTNNTIGGIRDGLGYIVEVDQPTQIITCGIAADTSLRVELISSLNIVGYTKPETQTARNYFSTIISNGDINQIRTVTEAGVFQRLRFNPLNGSNIRMTNSRGYLLDMTADYAPGTWRDDVQAPTSNFDRLFGYTNISEEFAGQYIRFVDAAGNVYGKVAVSADGTYDNMILFGDLTETERLVEGPAAGEELFAEFRGETIATGTTFSGNWNLRQLDLNFATTTPLTLPLSEDFKMDVFPNPTAGLVTVNLSLEQDAEMVRFEVYSTLGQLVAEREVEGLLSGRHSVELNLEQLAAGTYHVRVLTEAGMKGHQQLIRR